MKCWPLLLVFGILFNFASVAQAQVPPEKAVSTFSVADGLEISLWASEPLFVNPTCIDIDHKGRVWVCESVNYRDTLHHRPLRRPAGDRIVILEDSRGTGKADKTTTFYQSKELLAPLGIAVAKDPVGPGYKVFVCQSPDILVFEDKDGDGHADGPPKKLFSGFGGVDHDHGVHGILIGPDGKLYFSVGDQGVQDLQSSDKKGRKWTTNNTDCQAGTIWRCDLDGKNLELIAHNFRNEYEPCVDSFGTIFVSDNDDDGNEQTRICYVMPGGNYGYWPRGPGESHWHEEQPGVVPKILRTYFGSPTGMCVYEGTLLPKKYWGQLLHTDAGPRHVRCYHLKPKGAGYDVEREDMVTSSDTWFRPSDICVAPDGSVFVSDWYDPGVGGHGMGDMSRGRIYRLAPEGSKPSVPKVDLETTLGIVRALASPALSVRHMAFQKIRSLDKKRRAEFTKAALIAYHFGKTQAVRNEQLWLLARLFWAAPDTTPDSHLMGINANSTLHKPEWEDLSLQGIRQLGARYPDLAQAPDVVRNKLLQDSTGARTPIRRELLLSLQSTDPAFAREIILPLASLHDGKDRFYLEALGIAVGHHDQKRREIILADFDQHFPEWNDKVADLVWELRPPSVMPTLPKRLTDAKLTPAQRARIVDILAASDDKDAGKSLLKVLESDVPAEVRERVFANLKLFLPGKWRDLRKSAELTGTIKSLLARAETRATGLGLIAAAEHQGSLADVTVLVKDNKQPVEVLRAAARTLGTLPSDESVEALSWLLKEGPKETRPDTLQALGQLARGTKDKAGKEAALEVLETLVVLVYTPRDMRQGALEALATTREGAIWLLELHAKRKLPQAVKVEAGRLLRNSPFPDLQKKALMAFPPPRKLDPKKLPSITDLAVRRGDADRGKQLVAASIKNDTQCLKCHTIRGIGGNVGPDLSTIGQKASRENLLESILLPSKAIADQYLTWVIETKKGVVVTGLLVEDTADHVTLRDANAKDTTIDKKDIESRSKSQTSLMPSDLLAYMTEDDLVDMVEYLLSLKTPANVDKPK